MKILFFAEFFPDDRDLIFTGGVETYNYFLVKELSKSHQVTVICRALRSQSDLNSKIKTDYRVIRVGKAANRIDTAFSTLPGRAEFVFKSIYYGLKQDADIIQGNNFVTYLPAYIVSVLKHTPSVAWYPDVFVGKWIKLTGVISGIFGEVIDSLSLKLNWTHFIALSNATRQKLLKYGIADDKISTIYAGIDTDFYKTPKSKRPNQFTILCVCRLINYKRVDLLIKAFDLLVKKNLNLQLQIVGDGPEKDSLLGLIDKYGLNDRVIMESKLSRPDLVKRFKSAHLFCLPSQEEGFGLVVTEAASCGLPYVVSDIPVFTEITHNGLGGKFFNSGDFKDLAKQIELIYKNKSLYQKLAKDATKLAQNYSWENISQQFSQIYESISQKKLKILMVIDAWFPHVGGGQLHAWYLAKGLTALGCEVTIVTRNLGDWKNDLPGVKIIRVGPRAQFNNPISRVWFLVISLIYCLKTDFDILHLQAFSPGLLAPIVKLFKENPVVFTVHGRGDKVAGFGDSLKWLEDLVLFQIPYNLEITVARNSLNKTTKAKTVAVIPNGVDLNRFRAAQRERRSVKNLLYVGRLSREKGLDILLESFEMLNDKSLVLTIVGEGEEFNKSKKTASKNSNIRFKGHLSGSELIAQYRRADLLVIPSRTEGHPLVLFEGWASKLPVLATRVGGLTEHIKDGKNGFLAQPDAKDLARKIQNITRLKNFSKITQSGLEKVIEYDWENISRQTYNNYLKVLNS